MYWRSNIYIFASWVYKTLWLSHIQEWKLNSSANVCLHYMTVCFSECIVVTAFHDLLEGLISKGRVDKAQKGHLWMECLIDYIKQDAYNYCHYFCTPRIFRYCCIVWNIVPKLVHNSFSSQNLVLHSLNVWYKKGTLIAHYLFI